ncbi:F-box/kelch-repeat protein At5g15710-like [Aristolochia californica]|uniref:F-box/kelch-repeat protein At5g15710-like n=1 Tax=Aristolochia californica TaxID=171875 RepID=UPI0035D9D50E
MELSFSGRGTCESDMISSWELLPNHIWETILSYLPISTLFPMKAVSKRFNSLIQSHSFRVAYAQVSHPDLYFVLFADFYRKDVAAAYNPIENKWVLLPLSFFSPSSPTTCCKLQCALVSSGALVLAEDRNGSMVVANLFTKNYKSIPPVIPSMTTQPYVIAIIDLHSSFKILAVSNADRIYSQMYDSETNSWRVTGMHKGRFAMLGSAVYLDDFFFCLTHGPDKLLYFELSSGLWGSINVAIPSVVCSHLLKHQEALVLVGGIEELGVMKRIGIWELDNVERQWRLICFMPDHLFSKLGHGNFSHFNVVDRQGKICFCKRGSALVLMYDLLEKMWWWLPPCPLGSWLGMNSWFGHALEPRIDVLI